MTKYPHLSDKIIQRADVVIEALPYIQKFHGKTVVIKYGGAAMVEEDLKQKVAEDILLLKYVGINPIIVHGGGPEINKWLKKLGIKATFVHGQRVTDEETMEVVEMVLIGKAKKDIVNLINSGGGKAIGLSGRDGNLIEAKKLKFSKTKGDKIDLGYTGEVVKINATLLNTIASSGYIPVVSSIGVGPKGKSYNINADSVAAKIAGAVGAEKLILLTDVNGVLDKKGKLIQRITNKQISSLIKNKTISGGMIPKIECCSMAIQKGVKKAHILNGKIPHSILLELFTDQGIGTMVFKG